MNAKTGRLFCGMLISAAALAGTASAADPEAGTVSVANPKVEWTGSVTASWTSSRPVILTEDGTTPCEAPMCDTFNLTVADQKDLTVGVSAPEPEDQIVLRIKKPDGSYLTTTANAGANGFITVKIKNAPKGDYVIDYWNYYVSGETPYEGYAQLGSGTVAPAAPAAPEAPQVQPPAPTVQAIDLTVAPGKASARKLAKSRRLPVKVTVSRAVTSVTAVLKKGSKTVGKGSLGATSGTKTLKLKVAKRLKKGTYSLNVVASDGTTSASKTVKVKVAK